MTLPEKIQKALEPFESEARGRLFWLLVEPSIADPVDAHGAIVGEQPATSLRAVMDGSDIGEIVDTAIQKYFPGMLERREREGISAMVDGMVDGLSRMLRNKRNRK